MDDTKLDLPPATWDKFIDKQVATHVAKDHDYGQRFMKGLLQHGDIVWRWEVEKKLDRLRTWIDKGMLKVKGEGCNNSVGDLFNYTVQYHIYQQISGDEDIDPFKQLTEQIFRREATWFCPHKWVKFLVDHGLIESDETELQVLILRYMGAESRG